MTRYVAREPKISKSNRAALRVPDCESNYFQPIRDYWLKRQADGKALHKWSGNISPSAKLSFTTCVVDFFKRVQEYLEFQPDTLMAVNMGTLIHRGFEAEVLQVPGLLYPFPEYKDDPELAAWAEKIKPEVPIWCRSTGIKGKIDAVLNVDGKPFVFDLKTKSMTGKAWKTFCENPQAEMSHIVQVCIYINRLNRSGVYPDKITHGSLGYLNLLSKSMSRGSFIEKEVVYADYREKTNDLIKALAKGRRQFHAGKKITCTNPRCGVHQNKYD
jgi:hypothetical protein